MNILTIDLEDWFHILDHDKTASPEHWKKFESRVESNADRILEQLELAGTHATFFCLGWIAEKYPALIRRIVSCGHEIACHSMNHQLVFNQSVNEFGDDLKRSIDLLQDISGKKIDTYRAPGFSVSENTKWVFEVLVECGIKIDCSIFPARRNHGGYAQFPNRKPCVISVNGNTIKEFPMSLVHGPFGAMAFSGGGYFRFLPYPVIRYFFNRSGYVMTYFHPRDFDAAQPVLTSLPLKRKMMSYVGLKGAKEKFTRLLKEFSFINVGEAVHQVHWNEVPKVIIE